MVSRPAPLWQRAARRIRHGRRALHRVDVRHRTRARDDSVSKDALSSKAMSNPYLCALRLSVLCGFARTMTVRAARAGFSRKVAKDRKTRDAKVSQNQLRK